MYNILLVEDDESIRQMVRDVLNDEGDAIEVAADGEAALSYLHRCKQLPQVILLDLVMPGMDGIQFLHMQHTNPRLAQVPVILFSASNQLQQVAQTFNAAYVRKPFDITELLALMRHCCAVGRPNSLELA
jgi:CheY-like chemotaxis protein